MGYSLGQGRVQKLFWGLFIQTNNFCFLSFTLLPLYHVVLSSCGRWWQVVPSDYLVSTQQQLWLFCCWGCGCCWAVTKTWCNSPSIFFFHFENFFFSCPIFDFSSFFNIVSLSGGCGQFENHCVFRVLSIFSCNNVAMSVCLSVGWSAKVSYSGTEPSQTY